MAVTQPYRLEDFAPSPRFTVGGTLTGLVGPRLELAAEDPPGTTKPLQAALMAGEFAVHIRTGDVYSVEEVRGWLDHAGWRFTGLRPLAGPQSLIVAEAA